MGINEAGLTREDLMTLVEIGRELAAEVNLKALLPRILNKASQLTDSPDASIILYDEKLQQLYFAEATGAKAPILLEKWGETSGQGIPIQGSKAGDVFTTGTPIVEHALVEDSGHFKGVDQDTRKVTRSMVCVPVDTLSEAEQNLVWVGLCKEIAAALGE